MKYYTLITGASRGIGRAIALMFASKGHSLVILSSHSNSDLDDTRKQVLSMNVDCLSFQIDVANYEELLSLKSELKNNDISIDCIINNAGIDYFGLIQDMSVADWNRILSVNLSSVFFTSKLFIPDMLQSGAGCILNISSVFGATGASCEAAYSATKGAINAFTKSLAKELAPSHIRVNAIACGAIDTVMNDRLDSEEKQMLIDEIPIGRMGECSEVAELAYSIYRMNEYLTGQIITMDGAWT